MPNSGYTRQSSTTIAAGQVANRSVPFNNEFNQIEAAFSAATGHNHDGSSAGVGPKLGTEAVTGLTSTSSAVVVAKGDNTYLTRTLTGTAAEITVTNGTGVSGNPTLSLPAALTFTGKTITGGTFTGGTFAGAITGNVTGNITGDTTGTHTGAVAGTTVSASGGFTGNVTGNLTGNVTGTHTGAVVGTTVSASGGFTGDLTGNAATATKLQTARAIGIAGSTGLTATGINFDGSAAINPALTGTLNVANGGTGLTTLTANNVILGNGSSTPSFVAPSTSGNILTSNGTTWTSAAPVSTGVVSASTENYFAYYAATGSTVSGLSTSTNGVMTTDGSGIPGCRGSLPSNITTTTQTAQDNSTKIATTAYVDAKDQLTPDSIGSYTVFCTVAIFVKGNTYTGASIGVGGTTWLCMRGSEGGTNTGAGVYVCLFKRVA